MGLALRPGRGLGRAGAARRRRLLRCRARRFCLHPSAVPDFDAVAAERASPRCAAPCADAGLVVAARGGAPRPPPGGAAKRRAGGDGARLVRQQLQRGADRRGPRARVRSLAAAARFAAQRGHLPLLRRARRTARFVLSRRRAGQPHRLGRARLLGPRGHAHLLEYPRRAHRRTAHPYLGLGGGFAAARGAARTPCRGRRAVRGPARHLHGGFRSSANRCPYRARALLRAAPLPALGGAALRARRAPQARSR